MVLSILQREGTLVRPLTGGRARDVSGYGESWKRRG